LVANRVKALPQREGNLMRKLLIAGLVAVAVGSVGGTVSADEHRGKGPSACKFFVPGPGIADFAKNSKGLGPGVSPGSQFVAPACNPNNGYGG
jgi:hypothetical protein